MKYSHGHMTQNYKLLRLCLSYTTDALVFSAWPAYKKGGWGGAKFVREMRGEREARSGTSCVGV